MLEFLGDDHSPFKGLPHGLAVFVFFLIICHLAAFLIWLVTFLRSTLLNGESQREKQALRQFLGNQVSAFDPLESENHVIL
jgi:hypothetical protein